MTVLRGEGLAPRVGHIGWSIQRIAARISTLDDAASDALHHALRDLQPTIRALCKAAEQGERLDTRDIRDLRTLCRRMATTLDHVVAHAGPDRLEAEALSVRYARLELVKVLSHACEVFAPLAESRGLTYEVDLPSTLTAELDRAKLELAVGNALFNAFKYAPDGGVVRCTARVDERLDDVVVTVEDSGPSVSPTQLDVIFDRTREGDRSVAIDLGDVRLSLGLSRDLVAVQGGILDTVPTSNGHALFELRVPRWAPRGALVAEQAPAAATWLQAAVEQAEAELRTEAELGARSIANDGRPLVLVLGGSRSLNRAVVRCLAPDYATASAFDGEVGLELALCLRPDLLIVDLALPGIDGEAMIQTLCAQEGFDPAILALTGHRAERQILRLLDAGVHDIMSKPVLLAELRARVGRLLSAKRATDVLSETIGQRDTDLITLASEVAQTHQNLKQAYAEFEQARDRAERLSKAKSDFLRIMSHELKTPVTAMRLQLSVLDRDPGVHHSDVLDRGLERLGRSTSRLLHLVDTVLEWSRVNDGRYRPEITSFDVAQLARDVAAELQSHAQVRNLELVARVSEPGRQPLESDRRLVRLVLINLVERAISVSTEGRVEIDVVRGQASSHVRVRDQAHPLTDQERDEVFAPLEHARDFHRRSGAGSGLGVYALCDIASAVGGEIRHERDGESGNVFVFDVPAVHPSRESDGGSPASP